MNTILQTPATPKKLDPHLNVRFVCVPKGVVLQSDEMCFFNQKPFTFAFAKQNISVANCLLPNPAFKILVLQLKIELCSKIGNPALALNISWKHWITCQPATLLFPFLPKSRPPQSHIFKSIFFTMWWRMSLKVFIKHFPSLKVHFYLLSLNN